jgi:hypothetical protein
MKKNFWEYLKKDILLDGFIKKTFNAKTVGQVIKWILILCGGAVALKSKLLSSLAKMLGI